MIMTLYNLCTKKKEKVRQSVENEKYYYIDRIYNKVGNPFYLSFFELCVENTAIDAIEYFVELECENNFFGDNLAVMDDERGRRLYKLMAMHHVIKLLRKKRKELNQEEAKKTLFTAFDFNDGEKRLFDILYKCICEYESRFSQLFSLTLAKYIFDRDKISAFSLAFIENFCYNSYSGFMQSFTKYISLNIRIKRAAN